MIMNREQIKDIIPHRDPFLLVDRVLEMEVGHTAVAEKDVNIDEYYFKGHFPDEPIMPGVLIIEAIAQTGAITLLAMPGNQGKSVYFGGLKKAKFKRKVIPGDTLRFEIELHKIKEKFGQGIGKAFVGNELACEAEFVFSYM